MVTFVDSNVGSLNATTGVANFFYPRVRRASCKMSGSEVSNHLNTKIKLNYI